MLVRKQLAHFNDALQGKTVSETSETPKKKGSFQLYPNCKFLANYHTCRTELFSPHAGLLMRIFGRKKK
jgi:hypothetical protein